LWVHSWGSSGRGLEACQSAAAQWISASHRNEATAESSNNGSRRRLAAPLARRQRPGLCLGRPARAAYAWALLISWVYRRGGLRGPTSSLLIVQLAATASRSPCGRRCAIGCAEPRPGHPLTRDPAPTRMTGTPRLRFSSSSETRPTVRAGSSRTGRIWLRRGQCWCGGDRTTSCQDIHEKYFACFCS